MDPPNKSQPLKQPSTNSPPSEPPRQVSQPQPQESEPKSFDEIQDSQLHSWFQEIFPGRDLPPYLQPQQKNSQDSFQRPQLETVPRANPLPWHKSPERLLLRQLYPHLDSLCTDELQQKNILAPRSPQPPQPRPKPVIFPSLDSPPHSPSKQEKAILSSVGFIIFVLAFFFFFERHFCASVGVRFWSTLNLLRARGS